jgi:hypothetical protein
MIAYIIPARGDNKYQNINICDNVPHGADRRRWRQLSKQVSSVAVEKGWAAAI